MKNEPLFERLRQLAGRLMGRWPFPPTQWPGPPDDPYAGVREPKRRNPGGRTSAVALKEPESDRI